MARQSNGAAGWRTGICVLASAAASVLTGCVLPPPQAIEAGKAQLIPGTVVGDFARVTGVVESRIGRTQVWTSVDDCRRGTGTVWIDAMSGGGAIRNVVATADKPGDKLFAQLCRDGVQQSNKLVEAEARRWASLTPEQREAEQRVLLQLLGLSFAQQREAALRAEAERQRSARATADAEQLNRKIYTDCKLAEDGRTRCVTQ